MAADVKQGGIDKKAGTEIYFLLEQRARRGTVVGTMHVVLRTTAPFEGTAPFTRDLVREIDPTVPIVRLREMDEVLQESIRRPRLLSHTVSIFAGLALLISVIGTYGLLSYTVTNRRREIGIRLALGASRAAILAHILRWGLALVLIGTVADGHTGYWTFPRHPREGWGRPFGRMALAGPSRPPFTAKDHN